MSAVRWGGAAGVAFAVLLVASVMLVGDAPGGDDPDSEIIEWYEDRGNQARLLVAAYLFSSAALALLLFVSLGLLQVLRSAVRSADVYRTLAISAGTAAACGIFAAGIGVSAVAAGAVFQDEPVDAGVARFLVHAGYGSLLLWGALAVALLIVTVSVAALREAVLPRWFGWLGLTVAVVLLAAVTFVPLIALAVWALIAGILLLRRQPLQPAP